VRRRELQVSGGSLTCTELVRRRELQVSGGSLTFTEHQGSLTVLLPEAQVLQVAQLTLCTSYMIQNIQT